MREYNTPLHTIQYIAKKGGVFLLSEAYFSMFIAILLIS